jgi:hypothetical protein
MCGMNPKNPANFTRGLFNKGEKTIPSGSRVAKYDQLKYFAI